MSWKVLVAVRSCASDQPGMHSCGFGMDGHRQLTAIEAVLCTPWVSSQQDGTCEAARVTSATNASRSILWALIRPCKLDNGGSGAGLLHYLGPSANRRLDGLRVGRYRASRH